MGTTVERAPGQVLEGRIEKVTVPSACHVGTRGQRLVTVGRSAKSPTHIARGRYTLALTTNRGKDNLYVACTVERADLKEFCERTLEMLKEDGLDG